MTEVFVVVSCGRCRTYWSDGETPRCVDPAHAHQRHDVHRHRSLVELPFGGRVTAVSFDATDPYSRARIPEFGLYLDERWSPPWPHEHVDWPDFGIPEHAALCRALEMFLARVKAGADVEIGCLGGHGRTGTALACLLVLGGHPADEAVAWVRNNYCAEAVETPEQEDFVRTFGGG